MNSSSIKAVPLLLLSLLAGQAAAAAAENVFTVGAGVAVGSRYSGSDEHVVAPVVQLDYAMANGLFASTMRGLGYGGSAGPLKYSVALGVRGGRSESDERGIAGKTGSKYLKGMGEIKTNATANFGLSYAIFERVEVSARAEVPVSQRDNGASFGVGITGHLYQTPSDTLSLSLGANFADSKYAKTYYGVNATQSKNSGYREFTPKSGLYGVDAGLSWTHTFPGKWSLTGMAGVSSLSGDASKSPLTRKKTAPTAAIYVSRSF
ncbi:MipA/OmpV family protein [Rugamonas sp. CCM 8940]|uniref:MipA/OmpV family protein n=1 Tax=Rugamonas sp. CCM 8940 TaxID=2765359 RepID=UPI0018F6554B|nr:MipA/OmpV family protein [Rugamonas sp. CCM 8940]MBJ7309578.1 MipA/OmpV family protein [Rugamonas sp. CCM 8940]